MEADAKRGNATPRSGDSKPIDVELKPYDRNGGGRHDARLRHLGLCVLVNVNRASAPLRGVASLRVGLRRLVHLFAFSFAELRTREQHFFPDLPDLDPPPYTPEITDKDYEYFQKVVDQGKEKKRSGAGVE